MKSLTHVVAFALWCTALHAEKFYPADWIRADLNLAHFFVYFGVGQEKIRTLQEILDKGCTTGDLKYIHWVIEKQRETGLVLPVTDITESIEKLVRGGFDEILSCMSHVWKLSSLSEKQKNHLIDTALEIGYPSTVLLLEKLGCALSTEQRQHYVQLHTILIQEPLAIVPAPINFTHHQAHGGDENQQIYHHEYRVAVAYALYHIRQSDCDFLKLIENLGHRRQRMAALGKLSGLEYYGAPTNQQMITYFRSPYDAYGQKIHDKFPLLPLSVIAKLNGREIYLTQINEDNWLHPDGEHREETLKEITSLCKKVQATYYPPQKSCELAYDLGKIIWWMSHAPPFLRGTPTVLFILIDAFCIYHERTPFAKIPDLNCEALTYDSIDSFAQYMCNRSSLPKD